MFFTPHNEPLRFDAVANLNHFIWKGQEEEVLRFHTWRWSRDEPKFKPTTFA